MLPACFPSCNHSSQHRRRHPAPPCRFHKDSAGSVLEVPADAAAKVRAANKAARAGRAAAVGQRPATQRRCPVRDSPHVPLPWLAATPPALPQVRQAAKPFVEWLEQDTESESDSDDE